ncbi:MAG: transposase [Roseateles sp.]
MHPKSSRRVHGAEFKAQVLAECQDSGMSVAAVALAHGLNVNLVRKWLAGRDIKRAGLAAPRQVVPSPPVMQFIPVEMACARGVAAPGESAARGAMDVQAQDIVIELRRGGAQLAVRWPSSSAGTCAGWLSELVHKALK